MWRRRLMSRIILQFCRKGRANEVAAVSLDAVERRSLAAVLWHEATVLCTAAPLPHLHAAEGLITVLCMAYLRHGQCVCAASRCRCPSHRLSSR